jgi:hypothetical protein
MDLSRVIGTTALFLAVLLVTDYALGEDKARPAAAKETPQQVEEQQKRKEAYERLCSKPLKSDSDFAICRAAYKAFVATQK